MNSMLKHLVNIKLNTLTSQELIKLGNKYNLTLSHHESDAIIKLIKQRKVDIFNDTERHDLLNKISKATDPNLARQIESLFSKLTAGR